MRIPEIDGLRAIAALAVIATHYFTWIRHSGAEYGWLGVDLFFVISGFLITSILLSLKSGSNYFTTFYGRRAFRIFPPYFFVLAIYFAYSMCIHRPGSAALWSKYVFYYASLVFSNNREFGIGMIAYIGLAVLWSLSVEELFYMFWAPAVRFLARTWFCALLAMMIVAAPIFRWALHSHSPLEMFTFYCRMDGLAFGALVALAVELRGRLASANTRFDLFSDRACYVLAAFALVFFVVVGGDYTKLRVDLFGITLADIFFASLIYFVVRHSGEDAGALRFFRSKPLRSVGMVSYSLYLVHYPLLIVSQNFCRHLHLSRRLNAVTVDVIGLSLTFLAAYAMWYGFESYSLQLKDRLLPTTAKPVYADLTRPGVCDAALAAQEG